MKKKSKVGVIIAIKAKPKKMAKEDMHEKENKHKYKPEKMKKEKSNKDKEHKKDSYKDKFRRKVKTGMEEFKEGKLHSGSKTGPVVTNPKQAIAISLSQAKRKVKK